MFQNEKKTRFSKSKKSGVGDLSKKKNIWRFFVFFSANFMAWYGIDLVYPSEIRNPPPSNYPMLKSRGSEPPYWSRVHNANWQTWWVTLTTTTTTTTALVVVGHGGNFPMMFLGETFVWGGVFFQKGYP